MHGPPCIFWANLTAFSLVAVSATGALFLDDLGAIVEVVGAIGGFGVTVRTPLDTAAPQQHGALAGLNVRNRGLRCASPEQLSLIRNCPGRVWLAVVVVACLRSCRTVPRRRAVCAAVGGLLQPPLPRPAGPLAALAQGRVCHYVTIFI